MKHRIVLVVIVVVVALLLFVLTEVLVIKYSGKPVPAPSIPRDSQTLGNGPQLSYVVMGDSTSIGQGTEYKNSYAEASAQHLAQHYRVRFVNVGISGAIAKDIPLTQLEKAAGHKPDLVLLAVGANDARRFTDGKTMQTALQATVDGLKRANPNVRIVVTGSPAMDAVPRFPWPSNKLMGLRTRQVNSAFGPVIQRNHLTFAPIADRTRAAFLADPTLFAADKFHPNARGYVLWKPVVNAALDEALDKSPL